MQGLKTQESNKFIKFFEIVQSAARNQNCVFFLYAGDGRDFETEALEGEDLMGWLIPEDKAGDFEIIWKNGDVSDEWSEFFTFAVWENDKAPKIKFS